MLSALVLVIHADSYTMFFFAGSRPCSVVVICPTSCRDRTSAGVRLVSAGLTTDESTASNVRSGTVRRIFGITVDSARVIRA